jgi:hypothetical protein
LPLHPIGWERGHVRVGSIIMQCDVLLRMMLRATFPHANISSASFNLVCGCVIGQLSR